MVVKLEDVYLYREGNMILGNVNWQIDTGGTLGTIWIKWFRQLMAEPKLLIFDEPTNGLDFVARELLLESIEKIAKEPLAPSIIYVTHHVEEIVPVFNKTLLLKEGQVFAAGKTSEMISNEQLTKFFDLPVQVNWENHRPFVTRLQMQV